jgi:hypothetical protein
VPNNREKASSGLEPIPSEYLFITQKSLFERDLVVFAGSGNFQTSKLFAQSFETREI